MLGFPLLYFKGMRLIMFQLSGFHCIRTLSLKVLTRVPLRVPAWGHLEFLGFGSCSGLKTPRISSSLWLRVV